jgi:PleD family two-component response regulator
VSIGVAEYDPITGADSIIDRADVALYKAKQSGRNQIQAAC